VRIGSKVPVVLPQRITQALINVLKRFRPLWMSIHFTHPDEITPETAQACERLADAGIPLGSQTVLLKGVNDSMADAKQLVRLLRGIPAKINLIPFNPWPGSPFECSDWAVIQAFGDLVNAAGYASPVRMPRGRDIMAACGQLKSASQRAGAKKQTKEPGEASGD